MYCLIMLSITWVAFDKDTFPPFIGLSVKRTALWTSQWKTVLSSLNPLKS